MELPGGIEKDELGVALSYAIMLGGGAPSAPNGAAKSTPAVQPAPGQSKKAAKKEAKAKAKAEKKAAAPAAAPKKAAPAKPAPAPAAEEEDDDDFWGEDEEQTEEEKAAAAKELEEAKAKAMAKLAKKEANQRSLCNLEIKPWEADQDLKALYAKIKKTVVKDGLKWCEGGVEIKQMQLRGRRRVDGVGRLKFDVHTGPRASNSSTSPSACRKLSVRPSSIRRSPWTRSSRRLLRIYSRTRSSR